MLNVVTLWLVFVVNFIALGVVWIYVARSYPNFEAARFWAAGAFIASTGAALSVLRMYVDPVLPLFLGAVMMISSTSFVAMGVERFYGLPVSWRMHAALIGFSALSIAFFAWQASPPMRIAIYSLSQSFSIALTTMLIWRHGARHPGARFAGMVGAVLAAIVMARCALRLSQPPEAIYMIHFSPLQSVIVLVLVFLSIVWNFGFLLMAIDRLRAEVADLALLDDLTGVANRRRLLMSLAEECARSDRAMQPFSVLLMDIDEFKAINDNYGHAAGDECLRQFTRTVQQRLRTGDLLARMGGDEFCVVLPATTLHEAGLIARDMLGLCVASQVHWSAAAIRLSTSIGVAQWRPEIGHDFGRLIAAADEALYASKRDGKSRYSVCAMPPLPEVETPLRRSA
ncbi:GGDEF domain-containing protein [[Pseudomonas] carboxydohydrogena]|uniref:diguanylate cyclase n=1 Tax=Afipia carboxydohydrogena TaxID=290 RepID=A0ABY8BQY4_AFICR|nr:GGDEF domain-containing protein [[Pseudomonas] carboxydohydrogena]WEF52405.1 GGDEF domain-containing protein [[Pseudomonas] carboxydohydrogena]